jgi:hypothetical protein
VCDARLWAACIGGAMQQNDYHAAIEDAGFTDLRVQDNPQYEFLSENARAVCQKSGVKSISLLAAKT